MNGTSRRGVSALSDLSGIDYLGRQGRPFWTARAILDVVLRRLPELRIVADNVKGGNARRALQQSSLQVAP